MGSRGIAGTLAVAWLACAGVSVHQDYDQTADFSTYRTFDWFPGGRELTGDPAVDSPFIDQRVRVAVARELALRGYQKVEDRTPDFYVNYHVSVQQKLTTSGINTHYGIGSYGSWGGVGLGVGSSPVRSYEEGTLVIDFIDGTARKLVWRGSGSQAVGRHPTPEETTARVDRAVTQILAQFPPER